MEQAKVNVAEHAEQKNRESWGKWAFKHVAGTAIGTVASAGAFAVAGALDIPKGMNKYGVRGAAGIGAFAGAVSCMGFGHAIYNATVGQFEHKPSFTAKVDKERAARQKDNAAGLST